MPLGLVAQSVEQRIENPCVGGSIPPRATKNLFYDTPTHAGWRFCSWHLDTWALYDNAGYDPALIDWSERI